MSHVWKMSHSLQLLQINQFVRSGRWWTVAKQDFATLSMISFFNLWQSNMLSKTHTIFLLALFIVNEFALVMKIIGTVWMVLW
jgi:hypothetical protein